MNTEILNIDIVILNIIRKGGEYYSNIQSLEASTKQEKKLKEYLQILDNQQNYYTPDAEISP